MKPPHRPASISIFRSAPPGYLRLLAGIKKGARTDRTAPHLGDRQTLRPGLNRHRPLHQRCRMVLENIETMLAGRKPLGLISNIVSWNYPTSVLMHAVLVQALTRNAVISKTPTDGGLYSLTIAHAIARRCGLGLAGQRFRRTTKRSFGPQRARRLPGFRRWKKQRWRHRHHPLRRPASVTCSRWKG